MWHNYEKFQEVLRRFRQNKLDHRADMQLLIPRTPEGAYQLMLMYAASCLNYADTKRCMEPKSKFKPVLVPGWVGDDEWVKRIAEMGITRLGEYDGNDPELLLLDKDIGHIRKPRKGMAGFLPLFKSWQKEVFHLGVDIYPSGELTSIMEQMCQRAMKCGQFMVTPKSGIIPNRNGQEFRVKMEPKTAAWDGAVPKHDDHIDAITSMTAPYKAENVISQEQAMRGFFGDEMARTQNAADIAAQKRMRAEFDYASQFTVQDGKAVWQDGKSPPPQWFVLTVGGIPFETATAKMYLNKWLDEEQRRSNMLNAGMSGRLGEDDRLENQRLWAEQAHRNNQKLANLAAAAESGVEKFKTNLESTSMSKTNQFVNTVKGIFGNVVRMQRGRAAVHATKRIIFKAFPIKWGILARITGKAKSVEDHPLTDVAVALLAHGAANALLDDPAKREKYLKYTEEMVAASVAHAGLKMVPVEDILDKVLNGALDSEAIQKVKNALADAK